MSAPLKHPLMPASRGISVAARERPFDGRLRTRIIAHGDYVPTVAEILADIEDLPVGFASVCEARINGELVPRECWHLVRPRFASLYDVAVTFTVPLRGGGGASSGSGAPTKNPYVTAASIGILLVAAAVSGGALGFGAVGFLSAGAVNAAAGAAIGIGGALAVSALVPPPSLSPNQQQIPAAGGDPFLPASLSGNVLAPGAPVPRVIGTMRVFPPLACEPLVEVVSNTVPASSLFAPSRLGEHKGGLRVPEPAGLAGGSADEYAEAVFVLSGPHALSNLWIAGVSADDISELQYETGDGRTPGARPTLVTRYSKNISPNAELSGHAITTINVPRLEAATTLTNQVTPDSSSPQWFSFIAADSPDEIWLNIGWLTGLADTSGSKINQAIRLRFRKRGDVAWINCPELHFSSSSQAPFQKSIRFKWAAIPGSPNTPPTDAAPIYAFKVVPGQGIAPTTSGWTANSYFSSGAGNNVLNTATISTSKVANTELYSDRAVFYLDAGTFPKGIYEIQVMRSCPYVSSLFTPATYVYAQSSGLGGSAVYDFFKYYTLTATYVTPTSGVASLTLALSRVSSVFNTNPIQSDDFAWIAIKIHGRSASQLSILASGYVNDWDATASDWITETTTSNPAPHFFDVLTGSLGGAPVDRLIVNNQEIVDWRTACIANDYTINAVIEGKTYLDVLNLIASAGYARVRHNERWGIFRDKDRSADAPVQIFSARNMRNFAWTRAFLKRPTGIRAQFADADNDYTDSEIIIYDDPADPDGSDLAQFRYDGLVHEDDVSARATFDLDQSRLRYTFYSGEADIESMVCERGDLVGVQHDTLMRQAGFAYVLSVTRSGGNITGLVLEGTIPQAGIFAWSDPTLAWSSFSSAWSDGRCGLAIRYRSGLGSVIKEITAFGDDSAVVTFATPFADPGTSYIDKGCLIVSGPLGSEYKRLIVFGVNPQADLTAALTFVDEAPALFS